MARSRAVVFVDHSDDPLVDGVLSGFGWAGSKLTYAFPDSASDYERGYGEEPKSNFHGFNAACTKNALFILEQDFGSAANDGFSVEGFTNLNISLGTDKTADIRYAFSSSANPTAYAYYPGSVEGGDVWLGTKEKAYLSPVPGNDAWLGTIHETGHALGLKHGHESENGFGTLPFDQDSLEYSVMTYNTFVGDDGSTWKYEKFGAPQTFMMSDIAALQFMYGADYTTNSGKTVYKWNPNSGDTFVNGKKAIDCGGDVIFATIWDGGGKDTYDLSAYSNDVEIDLAPGSFSKFKDSQLADLDAFSKNPDRIARGNIFNALMFEDNTASLIENAKGGSGDDLIYGNQVANKLMGGAGGDVLAGLDGVDELLGGAGEDYFYLSDFYQRDTVSDFTDGEDVLWFNGLGIANAADALALMSQVGSDVRFDFGNGDVMIVKNISTNAITADDLFVGAS